MSDFTIGLESWHCWASGISQGELWQSWIDGTLRPTPGDPPPLDSIKPIQRRRLSTIARGAFYCANPCLQGRKPTATVFCSAHGEAPRAANLLEAIARGEMVSPNAFSLSVHNAIAGLFGIFTQENAASISVAAGIEGIGAAFLEAWCRQQEHGCGDVLVVVYDDQVPDLFGARSAAPPVPLAAGFLLRQAAKTRFRLERRSVAGQSAAHWDQIRHLVSFLQLGHSELVLQSERSQWKWTAL